MNLFKNIKIAGKIRVLSITFLVFLLLTGAASIMQISSVNSKIMELNNSRMLPIIEVEKIKSNIESLRTLGSSYMDATDDATKATAKENIATAVTNLDKALAVYKNDSEFKTVLTDYKAYIEAKDAFLKSADSRGTNTAGAAQQAGATQGPPADMANFDKVKTTVVNDLEKIINKQVAAAQSTYDASKVDYRNTIIGLSAAFIISAIITFLLSIVIIRSIIRPVNRVTSKLKEISESDGDLTQRINYKSKDEIGQLSTSFDNFMNKLQGIIAEVAKSAETITASSDQLNKATAVTTESLEEISNTVVNIASGTSDEAAVAEETTASLSEAARFSEATSKATKNTAYNSKKAKDEAENGAVKIQEVVSAITEIADSSKEVSVIINELDDSSKKIGDIIKIITSISEQTNLLALNAAIEAARAGEAGKGFSVVADEIRKLADESNNAAKEISNLVKENQLKSATAVKSVNEVEEKVAVGVSQAAEVGDSIKNIIGNIQKIVNEIEEINNANEQQTSSTKEIERAIGNIAVTSNDIAGNTENISASIQEQLSTMNEIEKTTEMLSKMAVKLSDITSGFKVS